jgi:hypothetical protein
VLPPVPASIGTSGSVTVVRNHDVASYV